MTEDLQKFVTDRPPRDGDPLDLYSSELMRAFQGQLSPEWGAAGVRHLFREVLLESWWQAGTMPPRISVVCAVWRLRSGV